MEGEAVVGCNEVDGRTSGPAAVVKALGAAQQCRGKLGHTLGITSPSLAHAISEGVVPFAPGVRELAFAAALV